MSWFSVNAPQPTGTQRIYPGGSATFDETAGAVSVPSGGGAAPTMQPTSGGGGDYQSTFMRIMGGLPATPQNLAAKEQELAAAGIQVKRNAEGTAGKIKLPTGQIVDVIQGAGAGGGGNWQWLIGPSGGGMGGGMEGFQVGNFTGGGQYPLASVMGTGLAAPWTTPFNAPDPNSITNDKALQWQMGRGMDAIQRSAAAKGTLLTGGLLKKLDEFGQGLGSTYYNDVYNRKLGEYKMAHDIFGENQQNLFNRLGFLSGFGANAAGAIGNYGNAYGTNATNLQTGMANSQSAGTVGVGNAIGNAVGGVINAIGQRSGGGGDTSQTSYNPNAAGPAYGAPGYVPGTGYPGNYQEQYPAD